MSVFGSDLNLGQEVMARGKRGKIDGVMFSAAGLSYRVVFPAETGTFFGKVEIFSAKDVSPSPHCVGYEVALAAVKSGRKAMRTGWNGKGMFIFLVDSCWYNIEASNFFAGAEELSFIAIKTADNKVVPWLASQTDQLAEDWVVLDG